MNSSAATTSPDKAPRWQRRKVDRPTEIITAALDVFVERGYAATRLDEVAARAGVTKGTLYVYFPSKEELFKAMARGSVLPHIIEAEGLVASYHGGSRELFTALVTRWWTTLLETPLSGIPKLMVSEATNFPELAEFYFAEVITRTRRLLAQVLEDGVARGEFRPVNMRAALEVAIAPVLYAALWKHSFQRYDEGTLDVRQTLDVHIDIFLRGIAAESPGRVGGADILRS